MLEKLAPEYPIINDILEYRGLTKLKSTYADGLAVYISENGRIHTTLNQTITATGRISSTEPNLQNIPIRMELGRLIRKVFVSKPGYVLMDADYSQIELRVLAHMSGDEELIQAYHTERKLSEMELKYLYVYLAYPEKFWKIANRYNNSHKAWLCGRNIEKLEKVIAQEEEREQFLEMLFHFVK